MVSISACDFSFFSLGGFSPGALRLVPLVGRFLGHRLVSALLACALSALGLGLALAVRLTQLTTALAGFLLGRGLGDGVLGRGAGHAGNKASNKASHEANRESAVPSSPSPASANAAVSAAERLALEAACGWSWRSPALRLTASQAHSSMWEDVQAGRPTEVGNQGEELLWALRTVA